MAGRSSGAFFEPVPRLSITTLDDTPVFSSATRSYNMYFRYPWSEEDSIEIKLPEGYEIDGLDSPAPVSDTSRIGSNQISINMDKAKNAIVYTRSFYFGSGGKILFPVAVYQPLKNLFDAFHKSDSHMLTVRQAQ